MSGSLKYHEKTFKCMQTCKLTFWRAWMGCEKQKFQTNTWKSEKIPASTFGCHTPMWLSQSATFPQLKRERELESSVQAKNNFSKDQDSKLVNLHPENTWQLEYHQSCMIYYTFFNKCYPAVKLLIFTHISFKIWMRICSICCCS